MGKKGLGKLLAGVGIGVGLGMLFAPKSGAETRKDIKDQADKLGKKIKDIDLNEVKDDLVREYEKLKKELSNMDAEKAKKLATKKVQELTDKANELVEMAKAKSSPMIEKTAKDVKRKLADLLGDLQEKLED